MIIRHWQRLGRKVILGGGLLLSCTGADTLWAQGPAPAVTDQDVATVRRNYMKDRVIDLPITMEEANRALVQEIHLYVKDHPSAPWVLRDKGNATQDRFRFQAATDGEYWFAMVTIDKQGRRFPVDLQNERPGLIVVIDTQRPVVDMVNLGAGPDGQLVQCSVQDANLDNGRVRFFFQGGDRIFRTLDSIQGRPGVFCIPAQAVTTGVVRLVAEDLAGNQTVREQHISHMATLSNPGSNTLQTSLSPRPESVSKAPNHPNTLTVEGHVSDPNDHRMPQRLPSAVAEKDQRRPDGSPSAVAEKDQRRPDGSEGPHWQGQNPEPITKVVAEKPAVEPVRTPAPTPSIAPAKRQIVNSTRIFLDYQIETTPAQRLQGAVEVWLTRDQGRSWHKIAEDSQRRNPIAVQLPGEGVFGLTLLVAGPQGVTSGPAPGEAADWWIEVDLTKPVAQINQLQVTHDKGLPTVHMQWSVKDTNLGDGPVELTYAASMQGPWLPIAKGLKAEGEHHWTPPSGIHAQVYVQLTARDLAGNECISRTMEPVNLSDLTRPRVIIRDVRTEAPATQAPVVMPPVPARSTPTTTTAPSQPFQIIQSQPR
jgi:hypothetical protein